MLNTSCGILLTKVYGYQQDPVTRHWWLSLENKQIGYFPFTLFPNMTSADEVGWGGQTTNPVGAASPPMGSGYFPDDTFHGCYFKNVTYQNHFRQDYNPNKNMTSEFSDSPDCFQAKYGGDEGTYLANSLQFGGPGGNCGA